jgi:hypothetical protein
MSTNGTIDSWIQSSIERSEQTVRLKQLYELQAEFLFNQYEPTKAVPSDAGMSFIQRLDRWVGSFDTPEDRWSAFHSLRYFFFIGQQETEELYRCAVQHKVLPWLSNMANLNIFAEGFNESLNNELKKIWPCPVTDSLRINSLLHRTNLNGQSLRPDWISLKELGKCEKIQAYVQRKGVKYLVLFEDFSGSGKQCERVAKFALGVFSGPVLLVPLVICSPGDELLRNLAAEMNGRLSYEPVVVLSADCLVRKLPISTEPNSFSSLRTAMANGYKKGGFSLDGDEFGFDGVGALVSSYSNCPNNTPPIFHQRSKSWPFPIFPRKGRA